MKDSPSDGPSDERTATNDSQTVQPVPGEAEWEVVAQTQFDPSETSELTTAIVHAVAEAEDVPPADVKSPPLYEVVDTAALEAAFLGIEGAFRGPAPRCSTEFMYRGHRVVVRSDGWVLVTDRVD